MSAPRMPGHVIEKLERFWDAESGEVRYLMVHRAGCHKCLQTADYELEREFYRVEGVANSSVAQAYPRAGGCWGSWA